MDDLPNMMREMLWGLLGASALGAAICITCIALLHGITK